MKVQDLILVLSNFKKLNILVAGDLMIDEYLWGSVERISPEAPVQVVDIKNEEHSLGGAGNVIKNIVSLDASVYALSIIDAGETGKIILDKLSGIGVNTSGVFKEETKISSRKTRVLSTDKHQQIIRIDRETLNPINESSELKLINFFKKNISKFDVIIISDYMKGVLTAHLLKNLISIAKKKKIPVIIDPKGNDFSKYEYATLITPNKKEAEIIAGFKITDKKTLYSAGKKLIKVVRSDYILITLGSGGMCLFEKNGRITEVPAERKEVYDVTGAGDTVISVLSLCIGAGLPIIKSMEISNIAAGIVVGKVGSASTNALEIIEYMLKKNTSFENAIFTLEELKILLEIDRRNNKKIVFTNGCFDILHAGHIEFLHKAKSFGNVLIAGINTDRSVRALKGKTRPIINQKERTELIASIKCVDYVILFDEDTPLKLITELKPDIIVKGCDYKKEEVVGGKVVESYGGKVELVKLVEGLSTTNIINKIKNN